MRLFNEGGVQVVAEAGDCNGDLRYAVDAVDAAAETGVWGFKVQMFQADRLVRPGAVRYDRLGREGQPTTQHELFAKALPYREWEKVRARCAEKGLVFLATPFDLEALDLLDGWNVAAIKLASGDLTYEALQRAAAETGRPLIVSTGAANRAEVQRTLRWLDEAGDYNELALLACTLSYPALNSDAMLARIRELESPLFAYAGRGVVGYSDHTLVSSTGGFAVAAGAHLLEKHFTITPGRGGDHTLGLDPSGMYNYVHDAEYAAAIMGWPTDEEDYSDRLAPIPAEDEARAGARRTLVATEDIAVGERLLGKVEALRPWGVWADDSEGVRRFEFGVEPTAHDMMRVAMVPIPAGTPITHPLVS